MEYIMIDDSRLKMILEAEDLKAWDVSVDELDYDSPCSRDFFEEILAYAKKEFGFDTAGYKTLIQLYPSRDGGCEIFVSRLCEQCAADKDRCSSEKTCKGYSFDKLSHLISVCKRLCLEGFSGDSSVWFDSDGRWFLLLCTDGDELCSELLPLNKLTFISEYGEGESARALSFYLFEYATPVCEINATRILGNI